jgi:hypothetical protein
MLEYIAFVYEDSMMKCSENCIGDEGDRERISNTGGLSDKSTLYTCAQYPDKTIFNNQYTLKQ